MEKKIYGGGKRYCVLCSHSQGQVLEDGSNISLHCLPRDTDKAEVHRRSIWIQRIKLVRPNAPINQNTRVCNLHFEGKLCKKDSVPVHMNLSSPRPEKPVRRPLIRHEIHDENNITELNSKYEFKIEKQSEWLSEFENRSTDTNNNIQFQNIYVDASTQDYIQNCDVQTQTTTKYETAEIGIQTSFPKMKPDDIQGDDEKTRFYTGFPTFKFFFTLL